MAFILSSPEFRHENAIPERFTCEGDDISPTLHWSGAPEEAQSLALLVEDPDAPDPEAPKRIFTHWIIYNLPVDSRGLDEAVRREDLPGGAQLGKNDFGRDMWGGPCPPIGRHRYVFKLYALDCRLDQLKMPDRRSLLEAMRGHILAQTELMGTYKKHS